MDCGSSDDDPSDLDVPISHLMAKPATPPRRRPSPARSPPAPAASASPASLETDDVLFDELVSYIGSRGYDQALLDGWAATRDSCDSKADVHYFFDPRGKRYRSRLEV